MVKGKITICIVHNMCRNRTYGNSDIKASRGKMYIFMRLLQYMVSCILSLEGMLYLLKLKTTKLISE